MKAPRPRDSWAALAALTPARIALGRSGASLPTREVLALALDHARARDAVHAPFDAKGVAGQLEALGLATVSVTSAAPDRTTYLRRPDFGRHLSPDSRDAIGVRVGGADIAIVIGDGLSSAAVHAHAIPLLGALLPRLRAAAWSLADVVLAGQARVALGDEIGERLGARMVLVLIGERPGLSSPDSLGAYLTFAPHVGRTDAERNCISNIRPAGLSYDVAAAKIAWLIGEALRLGFTGVSLKDDSDLSLIGPRHGEALPKSDC